MIVGIIYGAQSGIIRRYIHTDQPETLPSHVGKGEAMVLTKTEGLLIKDDKGNLVPDPDAGAALVRKATGFTAQPARCIVLDQNSDVVNVLLADPLIDKMDGMTLQQDAVGVPGSVPDATGAFQPLPAV